MAEQRKLPKFLKPFVQSKVNHLKINAYLNSSMQIPTLLIATYLLETEQASANFTSLY
jgi:hypothetical protein